MLHFKLTKYFIFNFWETEGSVCKHTYMQYPYMQNIDILDKFNITHLLINNQAYLNNISGWFQLEYRNPTLICSTKHNAHMYLLWQVVY